MKTKCLVTGGAGFIGSHIVDRLIALNYTVVVVDNLSTGDEKNINPKAHFINTDLQDISQSELDDITQDICYMFLCAALPNVQFSIEQPYEANKANVDTTIKALNSAQKNNIKKIVYSGSCSCYGNANNFPTTEEESIKPLSPYALQKYIGEEYCRLYSKIYGLDTVVLRYFNVYGPRMTHKGAYRSVLSMMLEAYTKTKKFKIINDGEQKRDFIHVSDVVEANILAMTNTRSITNPINIGYGKNYSVNNIADMFGVHKTYGETRIEPKLTLANISRAKELLLWEPKINLKDWIEEQKKCHI